jgi:hypothetical protein
MKSVHGAVSPAVITAVADEHGIAVGELLAHHATGGSGIGVGEGAAGCFMWNTEPGV